MHAEQPVRRVCPFLSLPRAPRFLFLLRRLHHLLRSVFSVCVHTCILCTHGPRRATSVGVECLRRTQSRAGFDCLVQSARIRLQVRPDCPLAWNGFAGTGGHTEGLKVFGETGTSHPITIDSSGHTWLRNVSIFLVNTDGGIFFNPLGKN